MTGFAVFALALVAIGIYGIVSYVVALRRREVASVSRLGRTQFQSLACC